jgi:hypothetical protein
MPTACCQLPPNGKNSDFIDKPYLESVFNVIVFRFKINDQRFLICEVFENLKSKIVNRCSYINLRDFMDRPYLGSHLKKVGLTVSITKPQCA